MLMDRLDNGTNPLDGNGDVELGTGQQTARVPAGAAQVDPIQHGDSLGGAPDSPARATTRPRR